MFSLKSFFKDVRDLFRRARLDRDIDEELLFHLEMRAEENIRRGMTPEEAMWDARRRFGRVGRIKELCRELRGVGIMETLWRGPRYGVRGLRTRPHYSH